MIYTFKDLREQEVNAGTRFWACNFEISNLRAHEFVNHPPMYGELCVCRNYADEYAMRHKTLIPRYFVPLKGDELDWDKAQVLGSFVYADSNEDCTKAYNGRIYDSIASLESYTEELRTYIVRGVGSGEG